MTIPTKEMFEAYFIASKWVPNENWLVYCSMRMETPRREDVSKLIHEYYDKRKTQLELLNKQELIKIFEAQSTWDKAFNSLNYRRKKAQGITNEAAREIHLNYIMGSKNKDGESRAKFELEMTLKRDPISVLNNIIQAYYDYFFTSRWQSIVELVPMVKPILSDAIESFSKLEKLSKLQEFSDRSLFGSLDLRTLERLKLLVSEPQILNIPFKRNDLTLRERGLVYDISTALRSRYRGNKAKTIYHLLAIDGIENSLELRTIERLLSSWRDERRAKLERQRASRQLMKKNEQIHDMN